MARWTNKDHITVTDAEFRLIVKQMRGSMEDKATAAAYLVMVNGMTQKAAYDQVGSSAANVNGAIQKITIRHKEIMEVYGPRISGAALEIMNKALGVITGKESENAAS